MAELVGDDLARMGPGRRGVRIVARPHEIIFAEPIHHAPAARIAEEGRENLILARTRSVAFFIYASGALGLWRHEIFIPFVAVERDPADFIFDVDEFQLRVFCQRAAEDEIE